MGRAAIPVLGHPSVLSAHSFGIGVVALTVCASSFPSTIRANPPESVIAGSAGESARSLSNHRRHRTDQPPLRTCSWWIGPLRCSWSFAEDATGNPAADAVTTPRRRPHRRRLTSEPTRGVPTSGHGPPLGRGRALAWPPSCVLRYHWAPFLAGDHWSGTWRAGKRAARRVQFRGGTPPQRASGPGPRRRPTP